ncbi:hypothetical protein DPMN_146579, partial [Dreissena polymorpha]
MCAWNNHYCWPGTCSTTGLTKDCQCADGFVKRSSVDYGSINAGETTCQPNSLPDILTCDTVAVGPNDERKRAISTSHSPACQYLADMYGNYQPSTMRFTMTSEFSVTFPLSKPSFIVEENFGISDTTITVKLQAVTGSYETKSIHTQLVDTSSSTSVVQTQHDSGNITVNQAKYNLHNGEALCLEFEAKAGGYLKSIDTTLVMRITSGPVPYTKVQKQRTATCPTRNVECYCPDIGKCEIFNYSIPLNKLVEADNHTGNHNRIYFFTITVTNNALLTTTEHIDVLVNDSLPEAGVIYEDINECATDPCKNGATCINLQNAYSCTCVTGWKGNH